MSKALAFVLALIVSGPLGPGFVFAQTQAFRMTGSMQTPRFGHTATLLPSGKVLVAGGIDSFTLSAVASAELYDPITGTWTLTGSMNTPRQEYPAILLPNGKVLVVGGDSSSAPVAGGPNVVLASAELYDPATGTWSLTGSMSVPRLRHTATLLPSGKVVVAGGSPTGRDPNTASAELYDPATGTFTPTGGLNQARRAHSAVLLLNGKVLVAGGGDSNSIFSSAELYDPVAGTWTFTGSRVNVNVFPTPQTTRLNDGRVLFAGGTDGRLEYAVAELYDPLSGTFSATGSLIGPRNGHTLTLLSDGKVLAAGGVNGGQVLTSAEIYDATTESWSATASMNVGRAGHTATPLLSDDVLAAGGLGISPSGTPVSLASAELFGRVHVLGVAIDIKPGSFPNTIRLGSGGTVPVAVFSSETFDARIIDPTTVTLASAPLKLTGKGTPMASFEDVNRDGRLDLVVHVSTEALQLQNSDTEAALEGKTFDGTRIRGVDSVRVIP